jgi:hypothetical protein
MLDQYLGKTGYGSQTDEPVGSARQDNLFEPEPGDSARTAVSTIGRSIKVCGRPRADSRYGEASQR